MTVLVNRLAELTGLRDRDVLDVTLVTSLREWLHTSSAANYRSIGEADNRRWLTRARLDSNEATAQADSAWVALESLPRLASHPMRQRCFVEQAVLVDSTRTMLLFIHSAPTAKPSACSSSGAPRL